MLRSAVTESGRLPTPSITQRAQGDEAIFVQPGVLDFVESYHDGHFVSFSSFEGLLQWSNGQWAQATEWPPELTQSGSSRGALGASHDGDTLAVVRQMTFNPNPTMELTLRRGDNNVLLGQVATFSGFTAHGSAQGAYYSPMGKDVVVPVMKFPADGGAYLGADIDAVSIPGGQRRLLYSIPSSVSFVSAAISEDGKELVVVHTALNQCIIEFHSMANGASLRPSISYAYTNGCRRYATMAPLRAKH